MPSLLLAVLENQANLICSLFAGDRKSCKSSRKFQNTSLTYSQFRDFLQNVYAIILNAN